MLASCKYWRPNPMHADEVETAVRNGLGWETWQLLSVIFVSSIEIHSF